MKQTEYTYPGSEWGFEYMEQCAEQLSHDIETDSLAHPTKLNLIQFKTLEYMTRILKQYPRLLQDKAISQYVHQYIPKDNCEVPAVLSGLAQRLKSAAIPSEPFLDPFAMRLDSLKRIFYFTPQSIEVLMCMFLFDQVHSLRRAIELIESDLVDSYMHILETMQIAMGWKEDALLEWINESSQLAKANMFDLDFGITLTEKTKQVLLGIRVG